jgi:hypothetical protein
MGTSSLYQGIRRVTSRISRRDGLDLGHLAERPAQLEGVVLATIAARGRG